MTVRGWLPQAGSQHLTQSRAHHVCVVCDLNGDLYSSFSLIWVGHGLSPLNSFCPHLKTGHM